MNKEMLAQVTETWTHHPDWSIGTLLSNAASIARGELRLNPAHVSDAELMSGLRALIPPESEILEAEMLAREKRRRKR